MKKRAYPVGESVPVTGSKGTNMENGSHTESGARGVNLNEMTTTYDDVEPDYFLQHSPKTPPAEEENIEKNKKVFDLLVSLGDSLDYYKEESLANFTDYLIKKFADSLEQKENPTKLFNQLMIKINNADLSNTNEILKKLTKIYSRTIIIEYEKNQDLEKSKQSAYEKTLHRSSQYLSEE